MPLGLSFLLSKGSPKSKKSSSRSRSERHDSSNQELKKLAEASRELSCVSVEQQMSARTMTSENATRTRTMSAGGLDAETMSKRREQAALMAQELVDHLKAIAPFNKRWEVKETINQGTYGVVFLVVDVITKVQGVIKVAKMMANDSGNASAEWEGFILEQMFKRNEKSSLVRLLDKGMLEDQNCEGLEFIVLERANIPVKDYIYQAEGVLRRLRAAEVVLQMLKGIFDLHKEGLLHRDLKPDNMGCFSWKQPIVLIFDLGMARMYTDGESNVRVPRTCCYFRGTAEWASGHALKGREQTRFDDLIAWLYVAVELFSPEKEPAQPLPWTYRNNNRAIKHLKSAYCPARYLLKYCPVQFYAINTYLQTANRLRPPNYRFLADTVFEAVKELRAEHEKEKEKKRHTPTGETPHSAPKRKATGAGKHKNAKDDDVTLKGTSARAPKKPPPRRVESSGGSCSISPGP